MKNGARVLIMNSNEPSHFGFNSEFVVTSSLNIYKLLIANPIEF